MGIYLFASGNTRSARRKLECIQGTGANAESGKKYLDKFLENDLDKIKDKNSIQDLLDYVQNTNSNVYKFAEIVKDDPENFKEAIKLQAKSLGTKNSGLFYKLIYSPVKDINLYDQKSIWDSDTKFLDKLKPKIKTFLLAKKDTDIEDDAKDPSEKIEEDDKKEKRMKNKDIFAKLKSGKLSNILKVFMALVLWDHIRIVEKFVKEEVPKRLGTANPGTKTDVDAGMRQIKESNEEFQRRLDEKKRKEAEEKAKEEREENSLLSRWVSDMSQKIDSVLNQPNKLGITKLEKLIKDTANLSAKIKTEKQVSSLNYDPTQQNTIITTIPQTTKNELLDKLKPVSKVITDSFDEIIKTYLTDIMDTINREFNFNEQHPWKVNQKRLSDLVTTISSNQASIQSTMDTTAEQLSSLNLLDSFNAKLTQTHAVPFIQQAKQYEAFIEQKAAEIKKAKEEEKREKEKLESDKKEMARLKEELMPYIEKYIDFREKLDEYNSEYVECWKLLQPKSNTETIEMLTIFLGFDCRQAFSYYCEKTTSEKNICNFSTKEFRAFWESEFSNPKNLKDLYPQCVDKIKTDSTKLNKQYLEPLIKAIELLKKAKSKTGEDFIKHLRDAQTACKIYELKSHIGTLIDMAEIQLRTEGKKLLEKVELDSDSANWMAKIYHQKKDLEDIPASLKQIIKKDPQGTAFIDNYNFLKRLLQKYKGRFLSYSDQYKEMLTEAKTVFENIKSPNDLDLDKISKLLCTLIDKIIDETVKQWESGEIETLVTTEQDIANSAGSISQKEIDEAVKKPMKNTWHNNRYYPLRSIYSKDVGAKVYLYWDNTEKRKVILKWFFEYHSKSLTDKLLALDSPRLPKIYEIIDIPENENGKGQGMIMEYIENYQEVSEYTLFVGKKPKELLRLCKETVEGIIALLTQGIGTPESKSGNHFIVDKNGHVRFIDFDALNSKPYDWFDLCLSIIFEQESSNCAELKKDVYAIFNKLKPSDKAAFEKTLTEIKKLEKKYP
ncbi:MAG: hypothetical protein Q4D57_04100 [Clostridia bacterium]|nr:hypothetical protein [Clostridia bacterium]